MPNRDHVTPQNPLARRTWFDKKRLASETCYDQDGLKQGLQKFYWPNTMLCAEIPYEKGQKQGVARHFHDNGQLRSETPYRDDKKHGVAKRWDKTGALLGETPYVNDVIHGVEISYGPGIVARVLYMNGAMDTGLMPKLRQRGLLLKAACSENGAEIAGSGKLPAKTDEPENVRPPQTFQP